MSRLAESLNKMRGVGIAEAAEQQNSEIEDFRQFYSTKYYKGFVESIENKLNELDRSPVTDPAKLVLIQGQRNAFIAILDDLRKKERLVNELMRNRSK